MRLDHTWNVGAVLGAERGSDETLVDVGAGATITRQLETGQTVAHERADRVVAALLTLVSVQQALVDVITAATVCGQSVAILARALVRTNSVVTNLHAVVEVLSAFIYI